MFRLQMIINFGQKSRGDIYSTMDDGDGDHTDSLLEDTSGFSSLSADKLAIWFYLLFGGLLLSVLRFVIESYHRGHKNSVQVAVTQERKRQAKSNSREMQWRVRNIWNKTKVTFELSHKFY